MARKKKKMKTIPARRDGSEVDNNLKNPEMIKSLLAILFTVAFMDKTEKKASSKIKNKLGEWLTDSSAVIRIGGLSLNYNHMEVLAGSIMSNRIEGDAFAKMKDIGSAILIIDKKSRHNLSFSRRDMTLLSSIGGYFRNRSESSWVNVFKAVDLLNIPELSMLYVPPKADSGVIGQLKFNLNEIILQLIGKKAFDGQFLLTFQQASVFTKDHKKRFTYEQYMEKQRELRAIWNKAALGVLRKSNKPLKIKDFTAGLEKMGVDFSYAPDGFDAKIGLNGKKIELYTNDNKPISGWPQRGRRIHMNKAFGRPNADKYVFKAIDDETGLESAYYTYEHHSSSRTEKFKMVEKVLNNIDLYKKRWEAPIVQWHRSNSITVELIQSAQAYFMYDHQVRIGSKGNMTNFKRTYGVTTWKVGHIRKIMASEAIIKYSGKAGVKHIVNVRGKSQIDKKVLSILQRLTENRSKNDYLWVVPNSKNLINAVMFRKWLKSLGFPSKPHKLRHAKGTKIASEIMASVQFVPDETKSKDVQYKSAVDFFKQEIATKVAVVLGHKSADGTPLFITSVKSYINPAVSKAWFKERGFRPPSWIPKTQD